jgi:pentatricopeptide repeat protein
MLVGMEKDGPEPNIYTYNTVTRAFAESGRLEEALKILSSIRLRGLSPDRFTFTTLLIACGRTNSSDEVRPETSESLIAAPLCLLFWLFTVCLLYIYFVL